jgi:hypothetical protein
MTGTLEKKKTIRGVGGAPDRPRDDGEGRRTRHPGGALFVPVLVTDATTNFTRVSEPTWSINYALTGAEGLLSAIALVRQLTN